MALSGEHPRARRWGIFFVLVATIWAGGMSWGYRYDRPAGRYTYLKVDFIAFYTAARMVADGETARLYNFKKQTIDITVDRAAGVPNFAASDLTVVKILPGDAFVKAAEAEQFPGKDPPVYVYNPLYAIAFMPLLGMPWYRAALLADFVCLFAFMVMLLFFANRAMKFKSPRAITSSTAAIVAACTVAFPVRFDMLCGQVTPLVAAALMSVVFSFQSRGMRVAHGCAIALIAGMKVLPLLVIVWLFASRRKVETVAAVATTIMMTILTLIFFHEAVGPWRALAAAMNEGTRVWTYNQSLEATIGRFLLPLNFAADWSAFVPAQARGAASLLSLIAFGAWGFFAWRTWRNGGGESDALLAALMTLLAFVTPLAWSHYGIYCFAGLVLLILTQSEKKITWQRIAALVLLLAIILDPAWSTHLFGTMKSIAGDAVASVVTKCAMAVPMMGAVGLFVMLLVSLRAMVRSAASEESQVPA